MFAYVGAKRSRDEYDTHVPLGRRRREAPVESIDASTAPPDTVTRVLAELGFRHVPTLWAIGKRGFVLERMRQDEHGEWDVYLSPPPVGQTALARERAFSDEALRRLCALTDGTSPVEILDMVLAAAPSLRPETIEFVRSMVISQNIVDFRAVYSATVVHASIALMQIAVLYDLSVTKNDSHRAVFVDSVESGNYRLALFVLSRRTPALPIISNAEIQQLFAGTHNAPFITFMHNQHTAK